jgi:membrane peptidoglycan carboxypeptidase
MYRERYTRRGTGGHIVPRLPAHPRLFAPRVPSRRGLLISLVLALLLLGTPLLLGLTVVGAGLAWYTQTAESLSPRLAALENLAAFESSRMYDRNGVLLYEFFDAGKRTRVDISQISPLLIQATVAVEDKSFFTNEGIDLSGIVRTVLNSLLAGEETGGASTITQQVIKNSVLTAEERAPDRRYERKIIEIILAQELTDRYSKDEILSLYLNENFYGNLAYGIQAASEVFFGVDAADLDLNQASLLAGIPQLPTVYNPINYLERDEQGGYLPGVVLPPDWLLSNTNLPAGISVPRSRQIAVLRRMVEDGYVSEPDARRAIARDLRFARQEAPLNAPHFVFYVRDVLIERYGAQAINSGGLRITTTLDLNLQQMAQQKAAERIAELEARNIHNASVVVMQPNSGQILAMVGSVDYNGVVATTSEGESGNVLDGQVNVATRERQPGSALKPFTYLSALEQGATPETVFWDVPTSWPISGGEEYSPLNYNGQFNGPVRMRTALANSLNIPAVRALKFAGIDNTLDLLRRVGIRDGLQRGRDFYGLSLTLGGGEVTPLELTTAYNTLASGGRYYEPTAILAISDAQGNPLSLNNPPAGAQVVDAGLTAILTDMMSEDRARQAIWGLNSPLKLSLPAAVKTGTTNDWRDAWAAGFTPFVTVGVWTGNNNNEATAKVESLTGGGIIWRNVMEEIFRLIAEDEQYRTLFTAPFEDGTLPTQFVLPDDGSVLRQAICELPGAFGGYREELFTLEMVEAWEAGEIPGAVAAPTPQPNPDGSMAAPLRQICTAYSTATLVRVPTAEEWSPFGELLAQPVSLEPDPAQPDAPPPAQDLSVAAAAAYCRPVDGESYPEVLQRRIYLWQLPPPDPDEKVEWIWRGGAVVPDQTLESLPLCTPELLAPPFREPPVAGAILMPDLRALGENQARDALAALGVDAGMIYADYQDAGRAGADFDLYPPYAVMSTLPVRGDWILPGETVVLGIRAPDDDN